MSLISTYASCFHSWMRKNAIVDLRKKISNTILISGVGRSGTTWLYEMINAANNMRVIFEPFHPEKVPIVKNFAWRQYIRPDSDDEAYLEPAQKILSGRIRNAWTDSHNRCIFPRGRIVKDIRTNLMLGWLASNFPELRIVVIMRHPCAVAASKLRLEWDSGLQVMLGQKKLIEDHLLPFVKYINGITTKFEEHIFSWCIEYYVLLRQLKKDEFHFVFYENLCVSPEEEMSSIYKALAISENSQLEQVIDLPSSTSGKRGETFSRQDCLCSWQEAITDKHINRAKDILKIFGMDFYYNEMNLPGWQS